MKDTEERGVKALYRPAKCRQAGSSAGISLKEWFNFYSDLYQKHEEPRCRKVPVVANELANDLLKPFTIPEIVSVLKHQNSCGVNPI